MNETIPQRNIQAGTAQTALLAFTRRDVAALVLLALLVALYFWRILTPNPADRAQFPVGDFTDQFYAFRVYEAHAFAEGRIPLWSENYNSGHPFLADIQSAVFYPVALVNTLWNVWAFNDFSLFALELEALLHFWLAGAFMYLFARRVIRNRVGAFTAAVVFAFGGYLTSYPSLQLAILETAVWLPLALFLLHRATEGDREVGLSGTELRNFIAAGLVLGVATLAGHPQTFLFVVAVSLIYFLWRTWEAHPAALRDVRIALRLLIPVVILLVIAFGIAAIQLVPAMEYQQLSTREALSFADAAKGFPTLDILQFILPGYASAFASPLYVGVLPLWLAIFALLKRRTAPRGTSKLSERAFWGLLALAALLLSFGFYVFAYVIFYLFIPGAALFRQQERLAFVVSFALAMLAGFGLTDLISGVNRRRATQLYFLLPTGAVLMLALAVVFFVAGAQNPEGRLAFLGDRAGLMLILLGLTGLLLGLLFRGTVSPKWFAPLAVGLILFDLWSVTETANKGQVQERFADIPFAEQLKNDTTEFRVAADDGLLPGHFGIVTGLEEIGGISPLRLARYDALLGAPPFTRDALLNVKYAITKNPDVVYGEVIAQDGELSLLRILNTLPRAWVVGHVMVGDDNKTREALTSIAGVPVQETVLLPAEPPFPALPDADLGQVTFIEREAEHSVFNVSSPADGLVVISENFYPGWHATVDGQPTEILRADLTLRAIPIRAGQHRIEMWYDPLSFKIGAALSALALIGCAGALVWLRRRA